MHFQKFINSRGVVRINRMHFVNQKTQENKIGNRGIIFITIQRRFKLKKSQKRNKKKQKIEGN